MKKIVKLFLKLGLIAVVAAFCWPMNGCREEFGSFREGTVRLRFSQDTVRFDTVFTTHASITRKVLVYNPYKEAVRIDRISLAGRDMRSPFRINVSGNTAMVQRDVVIAPQDSLYVFINVLINYQDRTNPFEFVDYLRFEVSGNKPQQVVLTAWGQDANYYKADRRVTVPFHDPGLFNPDADSVTLSYFEYDPSVHTFTDPKPYVIFGYLAVGEGQTLVIPAGTRLYFGTQSGIWVRQGAQLKIEGTLGAPVYMTGIRQDGDYRQAPGQWGRIWLDAESGPHEADYAYIRNGQTGFWLDSSLVALRQGQPGLTVRNTRIENMASYGIFCRRNSVLGENLCLAQNAVGVASYRGGACEFVHSTFVSDRMGAARCFTLCDYDFDDAGGDKRPYDLQKILFANSSFTGYSQQQLYVDLANNTEAYPQIRFTHCLIYLDPPATDNPWFDSCIWNKKPHFINSENYDFRVDTAASPLPGAGSAEFVRGTCLYDITGKARNNPPTIGAYE